MKNRRQGFILLDTVAVIFIVGWLTTVIVDHERNGSKKAEVQTQEQVAVVK